jgi:regulator of nonsense transcripts 1
LDNVSIRWYTGLNRKTIFWFPRPVSEAEFKINTGDQVIIRHPNPTLTTRNWFAVGVIIDIPQKLTSEVLVEIKPGFKCHTKTTIGYGIELVWNSVSYDRMRAAINTLVRNNKCMSIRLLDLLMGNGDQHQESDFEPLNLKDVSAPNLPPLNHSQAHAVRSALRRSLTLIQGPPGTGKTVTSASIVYHLAQRGPVLVVASSNVAVDHLTEKIHQSGLRVVRITSKARETLDSSVSFLSLHIQARAVSKDPELDRLHKLKLEFGRISQDDQNRYLKLIRKAEKLVLDSSQVICCTCVGAGGPSVLNRKFSSVLIDEATQATEPEALISLVHGVSQVIMVGDHRQLGPVIMNKACSKVGFDRSMFERLMQVGIRPIRLQVQYRMHPSLSEFPYNMFYNGSLKNGVTITERIRPELDFSWPNSNVPMFFLSCFGSEELASTGISYLNLVEAETVEKIVTKLLKSSVHPSQIGIITPYQGQRAFIMQMMIMNGHMKKELYEAIEVASVDAFQGREKDYIILSCVRSNDHSSIGFLSDARRMNVALTRARYGLIILGNPKVLSKNRLWNKLICHFKKIQVLMEGNIGNLQPSPLDFSRSTYQD